MENVTLYRKYRPINFDTVVGQDAIVKTLTNQINSQKIAHAYLFCGTRGTGKTTVAKIFARALNCKNRKDANPCNTCETCLSILNESDLNIVEMDAAANNGVDDIRNLKDLVDYPPANDEKYKVFIIDEAHMLTSSATDAFLKTLEEPPSYVVFILCTTEPNQFKQTIISRCQRYDFKRISVNDIIKNLKNICEKENIKITEDALSFIALKGDGSMRESISLLDRITAYSYNEEIDLIKAENVLGVVDDKNFSELTLSITRQNIKNSIDIINKNLDEGKEIIQFVNDYIWFLRNLMLIKHLDKENEFLSISKEKFDELKTLSKEISLDNIIYFIQKLSNTLRIMKYDENKRVLLETCIINLAIPELDSTNEAILNRLAILEDKFSKNTFVQVEQVKTNEEIKTTKEPETKETKEKPNKEITEIKVSKANYEEVKEIIDKWLDVISSFDRMNINFLKNSQVLPSIKNIESTIDIIPSTDLSYQMLKRHNIETQLNTRVKEIMNKDITFNIVNKQAEKISTNVKIKIDDVIEEKIGLKVEVVD